MGRRGIRTPAFLTRAGVCMDHLSCCHRHFSSTALTVSTRQTFCWPRISSRQSLRGSRLAKTSSRWQWSPIRVGLRVRSPVPRRIPSTTSAIRACFASITQALKPLAAPAPFPTTSSAPRAHPTLASTSATSKSTATVVIRAPSAQAGKRHQTRSVLTPAPAAKANTTAVFSNQ